MLLEEHELWHLVDKKAAPLTDVAIVHWNMTRRWPMQSMSSLTQWKITWSLISQKRRLIRRYLMPWSFYIRTDNVASYLIEIIKSRDQPGTVGEEVKSEELIYIALNGLSSSWQPFLWGVRAWDKLPTLEKLWEIVTWIEEEDKNLALINRMKKESKN